MRYPLDIRIIPHRTRGAAFATGFAASGYTLNGAGTSNSDAQITIDGGTTYMFVGKNIPVPPDSTLTLEKPINLESNDKIALVCDTAFTLQAVASIMEVN